MIENKTPHFFYPVWDPLLRALHWWNVATLLLQIFLGTVLYIFGDEIKGDLHHTLVTVHIANGYMFGAGVLTRILWLFVGPFTAQWRDLLPVTASQRRVVTDTLRYYVRFLRGEAPLYFAHNQFAGMIYALFFVVASIQILTGSMTADMPEDQRGGSITLSWHLLGYTFFLFYVVAHVFAVFVHEWAERHGLIASMIHGNKTFTEEEWQRLAAQNPSIKKEE